MALTFANKVTVGRILSVPFFLAAVLYYNSQREYLRFIALGIFSLAVVTDIIDGYIARTRHQKTQAGAILDPLADKILLMTAFISFYSRGEYFGEVQFPLWLVLAIISRDVCLLLGFFLIYMIHAKMEISPTYWGKTTTFFQILCIYSIFFQVPFAPVIWSAALFFTLFSGVDYIRKGIKVLNDVYH